MGFDIHSLNLLRYARKRSDKFNYENCATMGRQSITMLPERYLKTTLGVCDISSLGQYCEGMLFEIVGAKRVDSFDNSDYESATFIVDMNNAIPEHLAAKVSNQYDLVMDFGTLEHIYNVPQALFNISLICKPGGEILHCLPANGWVGHGFYQFSPELFFSLYSEENGYTSTEVFLANCNDTRYWYKVRKPKNGVRSCAEGDGEAFILVRTKKTDVDFKHTNVQQSDFILRWNEKPNTSEEQRSNSVIRRIKDLVKRSPLLLSVARALQRQIRKIYLNEKISGKNPCLTKVKVSKLL